MFDFLKGFVSPQKLRQAGVLGMNARNYNIIAKFNKRSLYPLVDDKVQTKKLANSIDINTPHMIGIVEHQYEVKDLLQLIEGQNEFVIKPAHGSEGKGVLVVAHYENGIFTTPSGKVLTFKEVYQHVSNILSGLYSLGGQYDVALIEELVHFTDVFKNFSFKRKNG